MNVQISIRGRSYTLRTDEAADDLEQIARYVDRKMAEVGRGSFDEYTVALLAALNIASEFSRYRRNMAERLGDLDRDAASIAAILDAALPDEQA